RYAPAVCSTCSLCLWRSEDSFGCFALNDWTRGPVSLAKITFFALFRRLSFFTAGHVGTRSRQQGLRKNSICLCWRPCDALRQRDHRLVRLQHPGEFDPIEVVGLHLLDELCNQQGEQLTADRS